MSALLWLFLASATAARAQVTINAEVNKTQVTLDDQIVLAVTVAGPQASLPDPEMPVLSNFSLYSSGHNQSLSFVNGRVASSKVHTFVLVPRFVGKGEIGPIAVTAEGKKVQTEPIEIQVLPPGASAPGPAPQAPAGRGGPSPRAGPSEGGATPPVFVRAELDKKKAFVDEQVTLSVKFFTSINLLGNPQYNAPKTSGFIAEDLPPERHGNANLGGRTYYFSEIKTALFPAQAGRLTIGPATVRCQLQQDITVDPFAADFFERFFSSGLVAPQTRDLRSEPLILTAEPLPEAGKPADFSGAVGRYSISAAVDKSKAAVGEAVSLTVTVQGAGNLKAIADPKLPDTPSFRIYDTVSSLNLDKKDDRVRGSKVFKTVLVPRVSGELSIPSISFSYFDPERRAYLKASTLPIAIKALPAAPGGPAVSYAPGSGALPQGLTSITQDIRYLKTRTDRPVAARALEAVAAAGLLNGVPFLIFAGILGMARYRELDASDPRGARFRRALKSAEGRIKAAGKRDGSEPGKSAGLLAEALSGYLADKLYEPPAGLTLKRVQELLRARQPRLDENRLAAIRTLWNELDGIRFAPDTFASAEGGREIERLTSDLTVLLKNLEKELRP